MAKPLYEQAVQHIGKFLGRDVSHLKPESQLDTAIPGFDSLKLFELLLYLEDCFGVVLNQERVASVRTLQDVVNLIEAARVANSAVHAAR